MRKELDRLVMGSTHKTIYMPDIAQLATPTPPIAEQDRIVRFIEGRECVLRQLLQKSDESIVLLKERRAALITAAVTGQIDLRESA